MSTVVYAPNRSLDGPLPRIFLAGSIEMGKAEPWQDRLACELKDIRCTILNPRRPDWDSSWQQDKSDARFVEQVTWELSRLDLADIIAFWFDPKTMSPVTLLELGLHARDTKPVIVGCPDGYWRKGNLQITLDRYGRYLHGTWESFVDELKLQIKAL